MPITDLLWACPACGEDRALRDVGGGARCVACDTRFSRVDGARIRSVGAGGEETVLEARDWVRRLPPPEAHLDPPAAGAGAGARSGQPIRTARVAAAFVTGEQVVRGRGRYLNRIERYGPETEGTLELALERLTLRREGEEATIWPFDALAAIQASSRSLQVRGRATPLVSFRFLDDSGFFWERLLTAAVRDFYQRTGRGEIVEFQPRITVA